jgi:hypothetical protein
MAPTLPRFPGWFREWPSVHQCGLWCAPPVHAWRVTIHRGATLDALRDWLATFPVTVTAIRPAEADACVWMCGERRSPTCGTDTCCPVWDRQALVILAEDARWNALLESPDALLS